MAALPAPTRPRLAVAGGLGTACAAVAFSGFAAAVNPARTLVFDNQFRPGQPFPLLAHLPAADRADLAHGYRTVVFFDHSCDHCRAYLAALATASPVPPGVRLFDLSENAPIAPAVPFRAVTLPPTVTVVVNVPLRVDLLDGTVEATWQPH